VFCIEILDTPNEGASMPGTEVNDSAEGREPDVAAVRRRKYVVPSLSRYGTLADLTMKNGHKHGNDGSGTGCGQGANFVFSCAASQGIP
jgi:hypothetical protein